MTDMQKIFNKLLQECFEATPAGSQGVLPGAERAPIADTLNRRATAALRPTVAQKPCDAGLFGDSHNQKSLF